MSAPEEQLSRCFAATLSHQQADVKAAEQQLEAASSQPNYAIAVLKVVAAAGLDVSVRQAAAVNFKNLVKRRWVPTDADAYRGVAPLGDEEKAAIRGALPDLMLRAPHLVRAQLSEALALISGVDFPSRWPELLPALVSQLARPDPEVVHGVLATANAVFKRYRNKYRTNELVAELDASQRAFAPALLEAAQRLRPAVEAARDNTPLLRVLLSSARLAARIFYSLNSPGLTDLFENQLDAWMAEFHHYLTYGHPGLAESDPEKEGVLEGLQAAIVAALDLFLEINEEEFAKFLATFATDVWGLAVKTGLRPGQDRLAMAALHFLTTVTRSVHANLLAAPDTLRQLAEAVLLPALRLREEDEELFDMNPTEFIRRDSEGSDSDTRRRSAADLVKALVERFPDTVTPLFSSYVATLLAEAAASPKNWAAKDCAVFLVLALTVQGKTAAQGATTTNALVNLADFTSQQVLPELTAADVNARPLLKAGALKFVTTFRTQLPKPVIGGTLPALIRLLGAEATVVHSYAATAIERCLASRVLGPAELSPCIMPLLEALFAAFKHPDSSENEYVMRCVMRVVMVMGPAIAPAAVPCLQMISSMLLEVCKNPKHPGFNHYLFESVAALIRHASAAAPGGAARFEELLFPAFEHVLSADVQEFHPYVFQIFAQLIESREPPLPQVYLTIFPPLLSPAFWERPANVPPLVRLLQAYLAKAGPQVVAGGHLPPLLGVFQKLLSSKAHDHEGLALLNSIIEALPAEAYAQYLPTVWSLLFTRLQSSRTPKYVRHFLLSLATYIVKHGPAALEASTAAVQPGIMAMIISQVWLPNFANIEGHDEEKLVAVATTRCLTDWQPLQANPQVWAALRDALVKKVAGAENAGGAWEDGGADEEEGFGGYMAAYCKLANAARAERPVLAEIADPRQYVEASLQRFGAGGPQ